MDVSTEIQRPPGSSVEALEERSSSMESCPGCGLMIGSCICGEEPRCDHPCDDSGHGFDMDVATSEWMWQSEMANDNFEVDVTSSQTSLARRKRAKTSDSGRVNFHHERRMAMSFVRKVTRNGVLLQQGLRDGPKSAADCLDWPTVEVANVHRFWAQIYLNLYSAMMIGVNMLSDYSAIGTAERACTLVEHGFQKDLGQSSSSDVLEKILEHVNGFTLGRAADISASCRKFMLLSGSGYCIFNNLLDRISRETLERLQEVQKAHFTAASKEAQRLQQKTIGGNPARFHDMLREMVEILRAEPFDLQKKLHCFRHLKESMQQAGQL